MRNLSALHRRLSIYQNHAVYRIYLCQSEIFYMCHYRWSVAIVVGLGVGEVIIGLSFGNFKSCSLFSRNQLQLEDPIFQLGTVSCELKII